MNTKDRKIVISAKRPKINVLGHMFNVAGEQKTFKLGDLVDGGYVKLNQSNKPELVLVMALNLSLYEVGEATQAEKPAEKPTTQNKEINITGVKPQKPAGGNKK